MSFIIQYLPHWSRIPLRPPQLFQFQNSSRPKPLIQAGQQCNALQIARRSENYHPSIWDPQLIESLTSPYGDECFRTRLEELKLKAKRLLEATVEPSSWLELVDSIQQLGVAYHFQDEIKEGLDGVYGVGANAGDDLYAAALQFRLLQRHGYGVTLGRYMLPSII